MLQIGTIFHIGKANLDNYAIQAHLAAIGEPVPRAHVSLFGKIGPDRLVPTARRGSAPSTVLRIGAGRGGGATPDLAQRGQKARLRLERYL